MSSIQTGIELQDNFSGVMYGIINSVNMMIASVEDMQQSMNADIDTSGIEGARDEINQATAAIEAMNQAASRQTAPDIAPPVVDGGKGQVNVALAVLDKLHLQIPVCGMVKDDNHRTRGLYYNNIEIPIDRNSEGFKLITRIQDEAHRFAIEFHRKLRSQGQVHSILDDIPGIGQARRKALMKHFMNLDAIKNASVEELKNLPSMNEKSAKDVYNFFH